MNLKHQLVSHALQKQTTHYPVVLFKKAGVDLLPVQKTDYSLYHSISIKLPLLQISLNDHHFHNNYVFLMHQTYLVRLFIIPRSSLLFAIYHLAAVTSKMIIFFAQGFRNNHFNRNQKDLHLGQLICLNCYHLKFVFMMDQ